jgi:hypothetical protein
MEVRRIHGDANLKIMWKAGIITAKIFGTY